jgi:predicted dehydrogenase
MKKIRFAVVGTGYLGSFHAQKIHNMTRADLVAVVDSQSDKASVLADQYGCLAMKDYQDLQALNLDAVVISTTTPSHYLIAQFFLRAGIHCFIEKPMTLTVDQADKLIILGKRHKALIQVGHIERFNLALGDLLSAGLSPLFIESNRIAPYHQRGTDVGVILDLMIHDIDLVLSLFQSNVVETRASGVSVFTEGKYDIVNARLAFQCGGVANLTASRVGLKRERSMRIFEQDKYTVVDLEARKYTSYSKQGLGGDVSGSFVSSSEEYSAQDALQDELREFVDSISLGSPIRVTGDDGKAALAVALQIQKEVHKAHDYTYG